MIAARVTLATEAAEIDRFTGPAGMSEPIPVAAGGLYPWTGMLLSPVLAAALPASSMLVLSNALRLRAMKPVMGEVS